MTICAVLSAATTQAQPTKSTRTPDALKPYLLPPQAMQAVAMLAGRSDVLILGETHGTQEVPELTASLLAVLDRLGYRALALEIPASVQPSLSAWATGRSQTIPDFYAKPGTDGRGNRQMLALIHAAAAPPFRWRVLCFDESEAGAGETWQQRDARMARNLTDQQRQSLPGGKILAICGASHARTSNHASHTDPQNDLWPSFAADFQRSHPQWRVRSIHIIPLRGGYFNGGRVNTFGGLQLDRAETRHAEGDDWDLRLGLPRATPATFLAEPGAATTAPNWRGFRIQAIRITGNRRIPTADILSHMRSQPGAVFDMRTLNADLADLFGMGRFEGVGPFTLERTGPQRVTITIPVQEYPSAK